MNNEQIARVSAKWSGWVGFVVLLAAIAPYSTEAIQSSDSSRASRQSAQLIEGKDRARESMAEIAQARIERGCTPMLLKGEQVLLRPGMRGRDEVTGHPLAPGLVFCDYLGNTAVTDAEGYLTDFAATPKPEQESKSKGDIES